MAKVIMELEIYEKLIASNKAMEDGLVFVKEFSSDLTIKYYCITNDELVNAMREDAKKEREEKNKLVFTWMEVASHYKNMSIWDFIKQKFKSK